MSNLAVKLLNCDTNDVFVTPALSYRKVCTYKSLLYMTTEKEIMMTAMRIHL